MTTIQSYSVRTSPSSSSHCPVRGLHELRTGSSRWSVTSSWSCVTSSWSSKCQDSHCDFSLALFCTCRVNRDSGDWGIRSLLFWKWNSSNTIDLRSYYKQIEHCLLTMFHHSCSTTFIFLGGLAPFRIPTIMWSVDFTSNDHFWGHNVLDRTIFADVSIKYSMCKSLCYQLIVLWLGVRKGMWLKRY